MIVKLLTRVTFLLVAPAKFPIAGDFVEIHEMRLSAFSDLFHMAMCTLPQVPRVSTFSPILPPPHSVAATPA